MLFFKKKTPPRACPKCGKADGWHCVAGEAPGGAPGMDAPRALQGNPMRAGFGQSYAPRAGRPSDGRLKYCCDNCGHEAKY